MLSDRRRTSRRLGARGRWVGIILAVVAAAPWTAAAADDDPRLVLSSDGSAWISDVVTPMFDSSHVWVPGESGSYSVLFRNDSDEPAEAFAELVLAGPAAEVFESRLRMDEHPWAAGPTSPVLPVAPGQVVRLDLELTLPDTTATLRTALAADVSARVTLRAQTPETRPDIDSEGDTDGPESAGTGDLPGSETTVSSGSSGSSGITSVADGSSSAGRDVLAWTGASPALLVALSVLLAGSGALVVVRHRRRRDAEEDASGAGAVVDRGDETSSAGRAGRGRG